MRRIQSHFQRLYLELKANFARVAGQLAREKASGWELIKANIEEQEELFGWRRRILRANRVNFWVV